MGSSGRNRCPTCRGEAPRSRWFPFCSERCQLIDLGRWIDEEYWVAGDPERREES
jgi:hypothetical protein